ncbi:MAG: exodeoxyribonuclease VII large subunit [Lentisphaeria bacterium]|nr:exodeoxyribonuclease VII large subunit [Lentisphaeria bacterium]
MSEPQQYDNYSERVFASHDPNVAWSVSDVAKYINAVVKHDFPQYFWMFGELVLSSKTQSLAHLYATLRDNDGFSISIVWFNGVSKLAQANIKNGDRVLVYGHIDFYQPRTSVQFVASQIRLIDDKNTLLEKMRQTLAKLAAEGLTDPARKKPLPPYPKCIGIVSSPDAAGYRDFLHTCLSRFPRLSFVLAPSKVQGNTAAAELRQALQMLDDYGKCDVIVLTRGGGSADDLWCFNDEALARAVAAARTPIITAVGHEKDTTLVDYVSDCNAITPTKAAEVVTGNYFMVSGTLADFMRRLEQNIVWKTKSLRMRLDNCLACPYLVHPQGMISDRKTRLANDEIRLYGALPQRAQKMRSTLDNLWQRLFFCQQTRLTRASASLKATTASLRALDPKGVLQRGYSILLDENQHAIRKSEEAPSGTSLTALLSDGQLKVVVT